MFLPHIKSTLILFQVPQFQPQQAQFDLTTQPSTFFRGPQTFPQAQLPQQPQSEFIRGDPEDAPTPPQTITRVRGRPIVPEDFPGPSQAVRGAFEDEQEEDEFENEQVSLNQVQRKVLAIKVNISL